MKLVEYTIEIPFDENGKKCYPLIEYRTDFSAGDQPEPWPKRIATFYDLKIGVLACGFLNRIIAFINE